MLGNPAKVASWMCECGHQLGLESDITACSECGKQYRQSQEGVTRLEKMEMAIPKRFYSA
jgi:hypothetical protein